METQKSNELRVRLRRVKSATGKQRSDAAAAVPSAIQASRLEAKSEARKDDFATAHFKLTAALEAAAAQASGLNFDWCNSKRSASAEGAMKTSKTKLEGLITRRIQKIVHEPKSVKDDFEEAEAGLVELVISTPLSSSCSSDDGDDDDDVEEGVVELQGVSATDVFTSTCCDVARTRRPQSSSNKKAKAGISPSGMKALLVNEGSGSGCCNNQPTAGVSSILALPPFDPYAPQLKVQLIIKQIVSLAQLKQRIVDSSKGAISKNGPIPECEVVAEMEFANIRVKHSLDEFLTFCSCKNCLVYREIVVHLMVDQFKAQHMVVMLVNALIKAYSPMLKNATAHNKFEKLLDANKEIYWMTCGYIYNKMVEHMYFIYDEALSDNMILVLFSAILLVNNPLLLLQILSFHVTCIVKAYAEGFMEIVDPDNNKIPAEEMLTYILDGYDDLCRISEHITCYLFAFENDFLQKFSLTWTLLCQRLYQQHVYLNLTDTMLACIITLKEDALTARHAALIKKYIRFDDKMLYVDKRWTNIWMELNKFNLSEVERKRRMCLMDVHRIFETVVQDAIELSLRESSDDNDFYDFQTLENRQLAWQNIMAYMKMKWPDGFFDPPNNEVCEDKCRNCQMLLEYHADTCKCITCSIAGGPSPPKRNPDNTCYKCLALLLVEKEVTFYESKILNACALSDDFLSFVKNNEKRKRSTLEELGVEVCSTLAGENSPAPLDADDDDGDDHQDEHLDTAGGEGGGGGGAASYHLAWAVFNHLNNRKRFKYTNIEAKYFCNECEFQACRLARKILNNEIASALSLHLIRYYQPLSMSREELRSILPNIMLYNRKMISSNFGLDLNDVHDLVVKIYWTFVISIYATYFIEFEASCPLRLENFMLVNNDIKLRAENLIGNKDDTNFVLFLDRIKGMENSEDDNSDEIKKKLEDILKICERAHNPPLHEKHPSTDSSRSTTATTTNTTTATTAESNNKKTCKDKPKKCCFDHSDFGEHCKENHSSKKRMKKECNHARMNETRDRLRKKLSQLVNARKNMKTIVDKQQTAAAGHQPTKLNAAATKLPAAAAATKEAASSCINSKVDADDDDSLECLNTLCKRISDLNTGISEVEEAATTVISAKSSNQPPSLSAVKKPLANSSTAASFARGRLVNGTTVAAAGAATAGGPAQAVDKRAGGNTTTTATSSATIASGSSTTSTTKKVGNGSNGLDMVNEIYELLGSYSKDQTKVKKWINETLSYIEGSNGGSNGKQQPQPTNAKKAAKKAKQKQRKEEEKRIAELHDLRAQFHDLYFKEFKDKHELKESKSSKKRDKKKISELETNIKKLQRAKAKVETAILELIATVKQTNTEFKFSYLPTKEQQQEKLKQFSGDAAEDTDSNKAAVFANGGLQQTLSQPQPQTSQPFMIPFQTQPNPSELKSSNIATGSYSLPYAHANNFPCHRIEMPCGVAGGGGMIHPPPAPMCYAPPQRPQLSQEVVAAMAANAACNASNDPSKRIVTIRRVNLPNVPEPQVTVTAKGSSPDKDKLLYTFVNGQLLQNGGGAAAALPPRAQLLELPLQMPNVAAAAASPAASQQVSSAPPPLSKTQRKKERRRLAQKLADEAAKAAAVDADRQKSEKLESISSGGGKKEARIANKGKYEGSTQPKATEVLTVDAKPSSTSKTKKKKKSAINSSSASTTSISTADAADLMAAPTQRRSSSSTSYSAAIPSSGVSTSSQINTRDNSIASQKPKPAKSAQLLRNNAHQKQAKQGSKQVNKQPPTPPTPTPSPPTTTLPPPPPPPAIQEVEATRPVEIKAIPNAIQHRNSKRRKFIDNGQFDNNPFKSLHIQDFSSDSEFCSSSTDEDEDEVEESDVAPSGYKIGTPMHINEPIEPPPAPPAAPVQQRAAKNKQKREQQTKSDVGVEAAGSKQLNKKQQQSKSLSRSQQLLPLATKEIGSDRRSSEMSRGVCPKASTQNHPPTHRATNRSSKKEQPPSQSEPAQQLVPPAPVKSQHRQQRLKNTAPRLESSQTQSSSTNKPRNSSARFERKPPPNHQRSTGSTGSSAKDKTLLVDHKNNMNTRSSTRGPPPPASEHTTKISCEMTTTKPLSKRALKQAQRNKHKAQKQHTNNDLYAGIPNNMGYFNPNDFTVPSPQIKQHQKQFQQLKQCQQQQYNSIQQQMQSLWLDSNHQQQQQQKNSPQNSFLMAAAAEPTNQRPSTIGNAHNNPPNVSIMDQLNRGVQVENLSLPPGITLTKVDPVKSELLRKKSESIKKLARPLQQPQQQQSLSQSFHPGATIIAPPVAPVSRYYGIPYAGVAAAAALGQNGGGAGSVIMLETLPPSGSAACTNTNSQEVKLNAATPSAPGANAKTKSSKSRKRRNKSKLVNSSHQSGHTGLLARPDPAAEATNANGQPKMVTLRNPMFHNGSPATTAGNILQQPSLMAGRPIGGLPVAAPLPMDQPASIIKNENGMFTIRNPALQQAVASGLAMGGYRQFGNVNYYTPQEAVAEAARASQQRLAANKAALPSAEISTFSYFSNSSISELPQHSNESGGGGGIDCLENVRGDDAEQLPPSGVTDSSSSCHEFSQDARHNNNISISCARIMSGGGNGLNGDSTVIGRPPQPPGKCISAIGSEMKNAQQQKQKSAEHQWINFGQELTNNVVSSSDALAGGGGSSSSFLSASACSAITTSPIQEKYQQSNNYYNGFVDVFPATSNSSQMSTCGGRSSNAGSLFDTSDCHMSHNCDDSPPPTITGFNHYLEGIPNTGVIRYDDATFLKTLMPGQNLNNEVSIHNINDSNFARNTSPLAHRVEISPVYASRSTSENMYDHCSNSSANYRDSLSEYDNGGANLFVPNNLINLTELESVNRDVDSFKQFSYDFEQNKEKRTKVHLNLNDLLISKAAAAAAASSASNRTSPYMDENAMDKFVQNINTLQLSPPVAPAPETDEQCSQLSSGGTASNGACKGTANGWW